MAFELVGVSAELISNQAGISVNFTEPSGSYGSVAISFSFAAGHYSKRQLLDKAKRLIDEASAFLKDEISRAP